MPVSLTAVWAPLLLGLAAWILGILGIFLRHGSFRRLCPFLSLSACCCSLWFPLYTLDFWAQSGDISAVLDCSGGYIFAARILVIGTVLLNLVGILRKLHK